jgi:hypothetical protein
MQVLYQLSYGPLGTHGGKNAGRSALARWALPGVS